MGKVLFIDIKEGDVSTYLFEVSGGGYVLREKKDYPLSGKYDFSIDTIPADIEETYLSVPLGVLNFRVIDLPFSDKDRIREVLPFELDGMILGGQENVVIDSIVTGRSDNTHQVLAVYLERTIMKKILGKLESFGADPVFVTSLGLGPLLKDFTLTKLLSPDIPAGEDRTALAVEEIKSPTINLRRDEFSYTRDIERNRKFLRVTTVLIILIALILAGDVVFKIVSTRAEIVSVKNDIRKQYQEIFPGEKNVMNELYQFKSHMKELKGKEEVLIGVNPLDLLLKLSQVDRQGSVVNEVVVDKTNITMKGEAQSLSEIQQFQNRLKNVLDDVNISDSKSSVQGRMMFTIAAKEKRT